MVEHKVGHSLKEDNYLPLGYISNNGENLDLIAEFKKIVEIYPFSIAIQKNDKVITYSTLDELTDKYAQYFLNQGISERDRVVLYMERSIEYVLCTIALLKIKAVYIPIDPRYSTQLMSSICERVSPELFISSMPLDKVDEMGCNVINSQTLHRAALEYEERFTYLKTSSDRPAYIMFTSGSTGIPKGVEVGMMGITNLAKSTRLCEIQQNERVVFGSSISFDTSVFEIWSTLLSGATLVIFDNDQIYNPVNFEKSLDTYRITTLWLTSSCFNNLYKSVPHAFSELNTLLIGGEALNAKVVMDICHSRYRPKRIVNAYGPTEATVFALSYEVTPEILTTKSIPIGKPLENVSTYIMNNNLEVTIPGDIGELFIGGVGVAHGYLNDAKLSKEKFVRNPFVEKYEYLYATGDMVRMLQDGNIEYIGRRDEQVKIRGYRVELGAVAYHMQKFPNITQATVLVHESSSRGKYLVGYFTNKCDSSVKINHLRQFLSEFIPSYMVPSFFVSIEKMPITPNGKVDKKALHSLHSSSDNSWMRSAVENIKKNNNSLVLPRTELERKIAKIYGSLLEIEVIYLDDDFFELGGHSLLVLRLLSEIEDQLSVKLELNVLYKHSTVEELALLISKNTESQLDNLVIKLRAGSSPDSPTVFFLPPIGGSSFCYLPLIRKLKTDFAVYATQDPAYSAILGDLHFNSLQELASYYLESIRKIQPHGPYNFVGTSFGATLVVELTRQLEQGGEKVNCAALIDGFSDFSTSKKRVLKNKTRHLHALQQLMPSNITIESPFYDVLCQRLELLLRYDIPKINSHIALFKAKELLPQFKSMSSKDNGWKKFSSLPVIVHEVPGNHETMLVAPNVDSLAKKLDNFIASMNTEMEILQAA